MKVFRYVTGLLLFLLGFVLLDKACAQNRTQVPREIKPYDFSTPVGPHHRVITNQNPSASPLTNGLSVGSSYIEVALGLNYFENGEWKKSEESISPHNDGAAALHGYYKVIFKKNINQAAAITIIGPDGTRAENSPLGIYYYDRETGSSVQIAKLKDALGKIVPPNQVIYEDAFDSIQADLRYTYCKGVFEADLILRESPQSPNSYGLSDATSLLELATEFSDSSTPLTYTETTTSSITNSTSRILRDPDIETEFIDFGSFHLALGEAFSEDAFRHKTNAMPVRKQWRATATKLILTEQIEYPTALPHFAKLPSSVAKGHSQFISGPRTWSDRTAPRQELVGPMEYGEQVTKPGFVLDYQAVAGYFSGYTFASYQTYHISGYFENSSGTIELQSNTILKFSTNTALRVSGSTTVTCAGATFTSKDDNTIGQKIDQSTGNPSSSSYTAGIYFFGTTASQTISNLEVRYAAAGFRGFTIASNINHTLSNCSVYNATSAIQFDNPSPAFTVPNLLGLCQTTGAVSGSGSYYIAAINYCPTISNVSDKSFNEDVPLVLNVTVADDTTHLTNLTFAADGDAAGLWFQPPITVTGTNSTRTITFIPWPNASGSGQWWVTVSDQNGLTTREVFNVTVNAVNDPPQIQAPTYLATTVDDATGQIVIPISDVDSPVANITIAKYFNSSHIQSVSETGTGTNRYIVIVPKPGVTIPTTALTLEASDGTSSSSTAVDVVIEPNTANLDGSPYELRSEGSPSSINSANTGYPIQIGPCILPNEQEFLKNVRMPETCLGFPPDEPPGSHLSRQTEVSVGGSDGCEYLMEVEIETQMRVTSNAIHPSSGILKRYDQVSFGSIVIDNTKVDDNLISGSCMMDPSPRTVTAQTWVKGGCGAIEWLSYVAFQLNSNPSGLTGAFAEIKKAKLKSVRYRDEGGCSGPEGCTFSVADFKNGSVDAAFNLGRASFGRRSASMRLYSAISTPSLSTPSALAAAAVGRDIISVFSGTNSALRQIRTPSGLVDIVQTSSNSYCANFYDEGALSNGGLVSTIGLYLTNGVAPVRCYEVCNPSSTNLHCLQLIDTNGSVKRTNQYDFSLVSSNLSSWRLSRPDSLGSELREYSTNGLSHTETRTQRLTTNGPPLLKTRDKFETFSFGRVLTERVMDPDSAQLTGTYSYYTNLAEPGYAQLRQTTLPNGDWQIATYDSLNRLSRIYSGFTNQPPTTNSALCRLIEYDYATNSGSGDTLVYRPHLPRRRTEFLQGEEVARTYFVYTRGEKRQIVCTTPGASWNNPSNLVTITRRYTSGFSRNELESVRLPNGVLTTYGYTTNATTMTTTIRSGKPDPLQTNIVVDGTQTVTVVGLAGQTLTNSVSDIVTGLLTDRTIYTDFDELLRPRTVQYMDGTTENTEYGCCGVDSFTDRDGVETLFQYDALKRNISQTRLGITTFYEYDAAGRLTKVSRQGTNGPPIVQRRLGYDLAGRLVAETNAVNTVDLFSESIDGSGQLVRTTTYAAGTIDSATRIETFSKDGRLMRVAGTAVHPTRYNYGVEMEGGVYRRFTQTIRLDAAGSDTSEWTKVFTDAAGRDYKTVYSGAGSPYQQSVFDASGQLVLQRDPDGVQKLYQYNGLGEVEYTVVDLNQNAVMDLNGSDHITQTVTDVLTNVAYGAVVRRTRTYVWPTLGLNASTLISSKDTSADGLRSWSVSHGLTNLSHTVFAGAGNRYVTNTAPDGSKEIQSFQHSRLVNITRTSGGAQIGRTDYGFDAHGRQSTVTDARNGTSTFLYDDADRLVSASSPPAGSGDPVQTTVTVYDQRGRPSAVTQPDGGVILNEYFSTGLLKKASGSRTYPVEYTYDAQGRMISMTTWHNHASSSGAATTTWTYDSNRGWLTSKLYANTNGPSYTYTPGGRLKTRTWARNHGGGSPIVTTYKYGFDDTPTTNQHPDIVEIAYNDGITPGSTNVYDRLGRPTSLSFGTNILTRLYTAAGLLDTESYTTGTMNGLKTVYTYDGTLRRSTVTPQNGAAVLGSARTYGYDTASRLASVSDATYSGTYAYLANSPLWGTLTFKQGASTVRATTSRDYDLLNRLRVVSTTPSAGGSGWGPQYAYNSANQRTRRTDVDGSYWVYEYDSLGQVISGKRFWADGTPVAGQQYEYAYDDIGNRISSKEGGDGSGQALRSSAYTRNNLNQYTARTNAPFVDILGLANASAAVTVNGVAASRRGEYFRRELGITNAAGPVATSTTVAALAGASSSNVVGTFLSPPANQVLTYDADGNLLSDGLWDYSWDGENRLLSIQSATTLVSAHRRRVSLEYDAAGRRVRQTTAGWNSSNSTWTNATDIKLMYDGWACIAELNATNNALITSYAWGLDLSGTPTGAGGVGGLLWIRPNGGPAHFAVHDGNGNVIGLVDGSTGLESARYEYDTFGNTIRLTGTGTIAKDNKFRFSTKRAEPESGLILYEYRPYSSTLGRWPNRDPGSEAGGANLYAFVLNAPMAYVDPWGLEATGTGCHGKCGAIIDDWMIEEVKAQKAGWNRWRVANQDSNSIEDYLKWANGNQRYKDPDFFAFNKDTGCGTKTGDPGCGFSVTLCGRCVRSAILGNIMYGLIGRYAGYKLNTLITGATETKKKYFMTVDVYDEASYRLGFDFRSGFPRNPDVSDMCTAFEELLRSYPDALKEGNKSGGFNDLTTCEPCTVKTKETRHGGAEEPRRRP